MFLFFVPHPPPFCSSPCVPRMIDMGFEEQVLAVLEAMGGTLKADDEEQAYQQEKRAKEARSAKDLVSFSFLF